MKRLICLLLATLLLCSGLVACDSGDKTNTPSESGAQESNKQEESGTVLLSFSQAQSIEEMKNYDGREVTIIGYMYLGLMYPIGESNSSFKNENLAS